jgi:hypothetical protein
MFVSTKQLVQTYGIDEEIARFFVNREPPANNLYWNEKLLYLRPSLPGYLFIPLIVDLLYKVGLDKHELLSEVFVTAMEQVGHISVLEETGKISMVEAIKQCEQLVKVKSVNDLWLSNVIRYLEQTEANLFTKLTTPFKSLHRGDIFLFSLSTLAFPETLFEKIAKLWFALISLSLLVDDALDIDNDKEFGDENAYIESGLNTKGLKNIEELVKMSVGIISSINTTMAKELERQHQEIAQQPYIQKFLNPAV